MGNSIQTWAVKTTTYTAVANDAILADTSSVAWTLTFPVSPSVGNTVTIIDYKGYFGKNNLTIGRNSSLMDGAAADFVCTETGATYVWIYTGATLGWRIFSVFIRQQYPYPSGFIYGLNLTRNSTDGIDIAVGSCRNTGNTSNIDLTSAFSNKLLANTWAVGSGSNGLDTGTVSISTWYYVWIIRKETNGTIDFLFSLSATAPTMPAGYTIKRIIGAVYRNFSGNIESFYQYGDYFYWNAPVTAFSGSLSTTSSTKASGGPTAYSCTIMGNFVGSGGGHNQLKSGFTAATTASTMLDLNSHSPTVAHTSLTHGGLVSSSAGLLRGKANSSSTTMTMVTWGWIDPRGKR